MKRKISKGTLIHNQLAGKNETFVAIDSEKAIGEALIRAMIENPGSRIKYEILHFSDCIVIKDPEGPWTL